MKSYRTNYIITGIILIVIGALTFRYPVEAIMSAGFIIGIGLIASGLNYFSAFYFFGLKRFILLGAMDFVIGLFMAVQPGSGALVIPLVMALWLASTGISRVGLSLWLGGAEVRGWWLMLLDGIVLLLLSGMVLATPLVSTLSVMLILAGVLIASGVLSVIEGFAMYRQ